MSLDSPVAGMQEGNGRGDVGKAELYLVKLQGSLVGLDGSLVLQDDLFLVVQGLFGDGIPRPGVLVTFQIHLRLSQQVGVLLQGPLGGEDIGLEGAGVDLDEGLAAMHQLPFFVPDLADHAGDLADDGCCIHRGYGADGIQVDPDAALFGGRGGQGDGAPGGGPAAASGRCRGGTVVHDPPEEQGKEEQDDHPHQDADAPGALRGRQLMVRSDMLFASAWLYWVVPVSGVANVLHQLT